MEDELSKFYRFWIFPGTFSETRPQLDGSIHQASREWREQGWSRSAPRLRIHKSCASEVYNRCTPIWPRHTSNLSGTSSSRSWLRLPRWIRSRQACDPRTSILPECRTAARFRSLAKVSCRTWRSSNQEMSFLQTRESGKQTTFGWSILWSEWVFRPLLGIFILQIIWLERSVCSECAHHAGVRRFFLDLTVSPA